ncbi:kelch-like protein [Pyxidicoccus parkwayensis]|uniref:Kelch-like protein n=1 Tax=Pyxidicoccus parkwayensis TaxID=2813578 RepID=A0ABX7P7F5_9BACT|nr:kelch repeat-containing protein [Pyxidicoccus parkwaysis]QSQ26439.1 kelch-like protein [Pyxidicoccus parkwaysis]
MPIQRYLPGLAAVLLLCLSACHSQLTGSAQFGASVSQALSASDVTRVKVTVSAPDMSSVVVEFAQTNGAWGGLIGNLPAGANRSFLAQAFDSSGTLRFQGQASGVTISANQTTAVAIVLQEVSPPPPYGNEAPVIDSLVASTTSVQTGASLSLTATVHDPNAGDTFSLAWTASGGTFSAPTASSTSWTAPASTGVQTLTLTVTDSQGAAVSVSLAVNVVSGTSTGNAAVNISFNLWPVVSRVSASLNRLDAGQSTSVSALASDADGDALSYQWASSCPGTWTNSTSSTASFVPSSVPAGACNNCTLSVTVQDGRGGQTTGSLALCVATASTERFPPSFTNYYQSATSTSPGQTVTFEVTAMDPQSSSLTFAWNADTGSLAAAQNTASTSRVVWTAPPCTQAGVIPTLTAVVTNAFGLSASMPFSLSGLPACAANVWTSAGSMAVARDTHTATLLSSGKVLVVGGGTNNGSTAYSELYDPATNSWSLAGSMASARISHTATLLSSGKVLVVGGYRSGSSIFASAELYDPATNSWSPAGSMGSARYSHTATLLSSGKVLISGGHNGSSPVASAELYDPATNSWSSAGALTSARYSHTATLLSSGRVLVTGGINSNALASIELYDPATNRWSSAGSMASARYAHTATLLSSGKVLVAGGGTSFGKYSSAELYEPATNSWSPAGSMASARDDHTATLLSSGKVLVAGGGTSTGRSPFAELYDPATNSWSPAGTMASARFRHTATRLSSGKVLISGGDAGGVDLAATELYTP